MLFSKDFLTVMEIKVVFCCDFTKAFVKGGARYRRRENQKRQISRNIKDARKEAISVAFKSNAGRNNT